MPCDWWKRTIPVFWFGNPRTVIASGTSGSEWASIMVTGAIQCEVIFRAGGRAFLRGSLTLAFAKRAIRTHDHSQEYQCLS